MTTIRPAARGLALAALATGGGSVLAADIAPKLLSEAQGGRVEALIVLPDQVRPALAPLAIDADYKLRRRARVEALRGRADAQQADLRAWLDARGIEYRPYWIANLVWARVSAADLAALAGRSDVARVTTNPAVALREPPVPAELAAVTAPDAIEWGVGKIRAPDVWAAGFTGQGVVIGGQDTGYQWDHPALKAQYRGWNGSAASHDYNWHDAIHAGAPANSCGVDRPAPCDDHGHGTHTAGTFAGDDGGANRIGVAPGATWIGCRNMAAGQGTPARYIECMQWFLAPTELSGANPDPDRAPDVISNSWGCDASEGCTVGNEVAGAVETLVNAGILFVDAAGNDGPGCGTILDPPAIYDASFVVGSTTSSDSMSSFSSRGPVAGSALIRPDVVAPGSSVRSSVPGNGYGTMSGTSMATPHVAGAAALLMSVRPALKGHPEQVAALLRDTAVHEGTGGSTSCGGLTLANWPNYHAGHGRIDVYAAALAAGLGNPDNDRVFTDGFDGTPTP